MVGPEIRGTSVSLSLSLAGLLAHRSKELHLIRADTQSVGVEGWSVVVGGVKSWHRDTHIHTHVLTLIMHKRHLFMVAIFTLSPVLATVTAHGLAVFFGQSVLFQRGNRTEHVW